MAENNDFATGYAVGRDTQCYNSGMGGFGYGGDWIWAFLLLALAGNCGFGFGGFGGGRGIGENYALATDFATIERKIDGVNSGICDSTFALNNTINNGFFGVQNSLTQGFAGINSTVTNGFSELNTALCGLNYNVQGSFNQLSHQISDCCCTTQRAIDGLRYDNCKNTADIIRAGQDNTRAILDYLTGEKISSLQAENAGLKAQISNDRQSAYLLNELKPCPIPAYITCNPNASYSNCGCGC